MTRQTLAPVGVIAVGFALLAAACGGGSTDTPGGQTTTKTSTPATTTASTTTAPTKPRLRSQVLRARIEDQEESPEFWITMPDYVAPGHYTLVVEDKSSGCAFHMWGPGVDVISRQSVSRFQIRLERDATYTATCNWGGPGTHHAGHVGFLSTDNKWNTWELHAWTN